MAERIVSEEKESVFDSGCRAGDSTGKLWDEVQSLWSNEPKRRTNDCNTLNESARAANGLNEPEKELLAKMYQALVRGDTSDLQTALASKLFTEESAPRFAAALSERLNGAPQAVDSTVTVDHTSQQLGLRVSIPTIKNYFNETRPLVVIASAGESQAFVVDTPRHPYYSNRDYDRDYSGGYSNNFQYRRDSYNSYFQGRPRNPDYDTMFTDVDPSDALKEVANRLNHKSMGAFW